MLSANLILRVTTSPRIGVVATRWADLKSVPAGPDAMMAEVLSPGGHQISESQLPVALGAFKDSVDLRVTLNKSTSLVSGIPGDAKSDAGCKAFLRNFEPWGETPELLIIRSTFES